MGWINEIGAFARWILKGCKTSLYDEIYHKDIENLIAGLVVSCIVILLLVLIIP